MCLEKLHPELVGMQTIDEGMDPTDIIARSIAMRAVQELTHLRNIGP
jgi:hypothetical protein